MGTGSKRSSSKVSKCKLSVNTTRHVRNNSRGFHHRFFVQHGFSHNSVLAGHSTSKGALHLGTQCQLAQVIGLLRGGNETLLQKGLVFQALQSIAEIVEIGQSGVSGR